MDTRQQVKKIRAKTHQVKAKVYQHGVEKFGVGGLVGPITGRHECNIIRRGEIVIKK